ncbi:hypothetical protein FY167_16410 [Proteus mirabilis]|uniref:Tc toxin subunit A-related protein n=1 Tax=Proteus mirabilis TaxID=584 RepID=UPI0011EC92B0|nr:neuraminidase-like domain-containing protein [Proteus mirabilis]QEK49503.1 hypothetical protein FY167_16410 [Proteus mirabilis]
MEHINALINKMNAHGSEVIRLEDLAPLSLHEIHELSEKRLSWNEAKLLYKEAQIAAKTRKLNEAHYLARNNPQVQNAVALGIKKQSAQSRALGDWIPDRSDIFVDSQSVASMFSPAAYLTELYREGRTLHDENSIYHIDKRRPDLAQLVLSQENMDKEISTLSLSNQILTTALQNKLGSEKDLFLELSTNRLTGETPYHQPYETIRQTLLLRDSLLEKLINAKDNLNILETEWIATINSAISPELYSILTEVISDDNIDELVEKNFGDKDISLKNNLRFISEYYSISEEEILSLVDKLKVDGTLSAKSMLKLNKIIRLHKATGISVDNLLILIETKNDQVNIDKEVICAILHMQYTIKKYGLNIEKSIVLNGSNINQKPIDQSLPLFDVLFNSPPLGEANFIADNKKLDFNSSSPDDVTRINTLKRAFNVDDIGIVAMWQLASGKKEGFTCSIENISSLYQVHLLSTVHGLDIYSLSLLLNMLQAPFNKPISEQVLPNDISNLIYTIDNYCSFIKEYKFNIHELYLMTLKEYDLTYTKEIESFVKELRDLNLDNNSLLYLEIIEAYTNIFSSYFKISDLNLVKSILVFIDVSRILNISINEFCYLVNKEVKTIEDKNKITMYIQKLHQMIFIFNKIGLNKFELNVMAEKISIDNNIYQPNVRTIKIFSEFHDFYSNKVKNKELISDVFYQSNNLIETLAQIYEVNEDIISQIMSLLKIENDIKFHHIKSIASYVDMVKTFNITPNNFELLAKLKFSVSSKEEQDYLLWDRVSKILQSGLNEQEVNLLKNRLDEKRSSVLSEYYINQFSQLRLRSRDDLYQYLLIDNKVSSEIKTTKIEQAISSMQLYINSCLSDEEKEIKTTVKSRQFFKDWNNYNKRYNTWSGISLLAYYPENYIDPSIRIGQTKMMDTLLQTISQNSINSDTIEDAFKTYLTSFEQIANLEVISGYHDGDTLEDGITYFIGRNPADPMSYYWRSADHSKIKAGVMAANAWTEWTKIENGSNPHNNLIRPVIFNNRLYIAWIESSEIASTDEKSPTEIHKEKKYSLNLSHIRYDGTWSSSTRFPLTDTFLKENNGNFHLSYNQDIDKLFILTYVTSSDYLDDSDNYHIYSIDNKMVFTNVYVSGSKDKDAKEIYLNVKSEFDILNDVLIKHINNKFMLRGRLAYSLTHDPIDNVKSSESKAVSLIGSMMNGVSAEVNDQVVSCYLSAFVNCDINYGNNAPESIKKIFNDLLTNRTKLENIVYQSGRVGLVELPDYTFSNTTSYSYYLGFDVKENIVYFFIYDDIRKSLVSKEDLVLDNNHHIELCFLTSQSSSLLKYSVKNKVAFTLSQELFNFSLQDFLYKETPTFFFSISSDSENETSIGAYLGPYGKRFSYPVNINSNKLVSVIYYDNKTVNDIKIELSFDDNKVEYSINKWSNSNVSFIEGNNSFSSQDKKLKIDIPFDKFNNNEIILTANIKAIDKQSTIISESTYTFKVKELKNIKESIISLKTNNAHAQYISMTVANKNIFVRLNTLFARQLVKRANKGIDTILTLDSQKLPEPALEKGADVPMDFNGANALYFWELFYYTPMMVANVMLEGQNYDEASRWLHYVFSPNGYIENGVYSSRVWNSQPLLTDRSWDKDQLDSTDPDAVAQIDPMHYKLATFMKYLDILIARGDSAYRVLERDTLNEAKMWYMQALKLLGDETELLGNNVWSAPKLTEAASKTAQPTHTINQEREKGGSPRTANSLTSLFLPQINEKLAQYRDTLKTRLFNLRHNLSIDGQPLSLPMYATPADPKALQNATVNQSQGGSTLPTAIMPIQRFPVVLNNAKSVVSQLIQFGSSLASVTERQDAQALSELLITQGSEIILQNMEYQSKNLEEFAHNEKALNALRKGAKNRFDHYSKLYDENISTSEQQAMDLYLASSALNTASQGLSMAGATADLVPNIYGLAVGGSRLGAIFNATSIGLQLSGSATRIAADRLSQSESYRRRREEWKQARDNAKSELEQIDAQLEALKVRKEATSLQLKSMKLQQQQTQAHLTFLQNKFTNKALYSWLHGKLLAIYKPFYDLAVSRCRMAELAYHYDLGETQTFIRSGAWQDNYSGLMAGESLMHNLTQMENSYLEKDRRALEITKIVSLDNVYQGLSSESFSFEQVLDVINGKVTQLGTAENGITLKNGQLEASIKLSDLAIDKDYSADLGKLRRVKQISVTLPALTGTYQNIRAVLSYGGSAVKPRGCNAIAISHGMNDSGQFQLNFNDDRYLPFEGLPVNDSSTLTLSFPDATDKQKEMLLTLNDIILHINYTIR